MTNRSIEQPSENISYSLCNDGMTFVSMRPSNATGPSLSSWLSVGSNSGTPSKKNQYTVVKSYLKAQNGPYMVHMIW